MSRITITVPVHIATDSDAVATGYGSAMDIFLNEKASAQEKAQELTKSMLELLVHDGTPEAVEQVFGMAQWITEAICSVRYEVPR